jgi:hypothetical protein
MAANGPTRRAVAAALPAAALASRAFAASPRELLVKGLTTYSESAMVMSVSADGRSAITLRFCRFPDVDITWLWCHVVRDGVMYAFTQHDLPSSKTRLADGPDADYRVPPLAAALVRAGKGPALKRVRISAALPLHKSRAAPHGPGDIKSRFEGLFTPGHVLASVVNRDRDEVYGTFAGDIEVGGQRWRHEGVAKFHEQRQTGPRFETPFCYSWLGGPDMAATTLLIPQGATGGWIFGDREDGLADMAVDPPGDVRNVRYRFKSGRLMPGKLAAIVRYQVPVYDAHWQGCFMRGEVDGKPVVGVMNDWPASPDIYAAAKARMA